ncbi:MAG: hypothetical protein HEQ29_03445 [Dolichospermum sp. LBC05a]|nr:hypothetical protein [Dolichospermum sp. OL01]MCO5795869.1 hypothetical protein [Dolichospermum sp. OL03]MCS6280497.1 hypothetical protein [Dolichospermum sp.]QSV57530.1 MAG: hypothetical protein HEQ29_03445 [Dolichospermum sp. LBC05a]
MSSPNIEIHEFSTGIHFQERGNSGWVSLGFTGQYMNTTMKDIPPVVERSIANQEFALTEGSSTEKPAIIGRVVGSGDDVWSVMAVVTRGQDEVGRSAAFYRYFLCKGNHEKLRLIIAWWESKNSPTFNPLDTKTVGQTNKLPEENVRTWNDSDPEWRKLSSDTSPLLKPREHEEIFRKSYILLNQINALAIDKSDKSNKNSLPIAWAFNVEALEKPERFQVIQPASQKAYEGLKRAIANAAQVVSVINVDEAALKSAIRSLMNSSTIKPEAVQEIVKGLENKEIKSDYWESLFNAQGADKAIKQKIYSPQMVRLITLRAMVIPETLPQFLEWLNIQGGRKPDENQTVSLEFQKAILALFPKQKVAAGIRYLLLNLLNKKISVDSLCWLLATNGSGSVWAYAKKEFITDVKYDLQLICNYFAGQSKKGSSENVFKCQKQVWAGLINNWGGIQQGYYKGEEYQPFAELFEKFREYDLAAYFYQVSDRVVKKELFYEVASLQNRRSNIVVFGLEIEPKKTLIDYVIDVFYFIIEEDVVKIYQVGIISFFVFTSGLFLGNTFLGNKETEKPTPAVAKTQLPKTSDKTPDKNIIDKAIQANNWNQTHKAITQIINETKKDEILFKRIIKNLDQTLEIQYNDFNKPQILENNKRKIAEAIYKFQLNHQIDPTGYLDSNSNNKENQETGFKKLKNEVQKQQQQ